jgi:hypothetical protein
MPELLKEFFIAATIVVPVVGIPAVGLFGAGYYYAKHIPVHGPAKFDTSTTWTEPSVRPLPFLPPAAFGH